MTRALSIQAGNDNQALSADLADSYWHRSELPLTSLALLLPLLLVYEAGTRFLLTGATTGREQQIIAFVLLKRFFALFGAQGSYMPALAVVGILLAWHWARKDVWIMSLPTLGCMVVEAVILAVPILMVGYAMSHCFPLAASVGPTRDMLILSLGAGVYEELVFRLMLLTFLSMILRDAFQIRAVWAGVLMVVISAMLFSLYHYLSPVEDFHADTFIFRTVAGIYFAVVFMVRGFGITAASHTAYDVIVVLLSGSHWS